MSNFEWNGDDADADAIVLGHQPRTAVYEVKGGQIVIRQEDLMDDHDDQVWLTPMGALQIAWKLIEIAHEAGIPKPDRKLMMTPPDLGPAEPPEPIPSDLLGGAE